ncbi:COG4315 family predicted lipoprotein [Chlorobium limicola]
MMCIALNTAIAANPSVTVGQKRGMESYLADDSGKTLYWFNKDYPSISNCTDACLLTWPTFFGDAMPLTDPPSLKATDFGTMDRPDGKKQSTFRGYPFCYHSMDLKTGDTNSHKTQRGPVRHRPGQIPADGKTGYLIANFEITSGHLCNV